MEVNRQYWPIYFCTVGRYILFHKQVNSKQTFQQFFLDFKNHFRAICTTYWSSTARRWMLINLSLAFPMLFLHAKFLSRDFIDTVKQYRTGQREVPISEPLLLKGWHGVWGDCSPEWQMLQTWWTVMLHVQLPHLRLWPETTFFFFSSI